MKESREVKTREKNVYGGEGSIKFPFRRKGVFFSLFLFSFLLSGLLLIDRVIPPEENIYKVNSWKVILEGNEYSEWPELFPITDDLIFKVRVGENRVVLKTKDARELQVGDSVRLFKTKLFSSVLYLKKGERMIFPQFNLYSWFLLIPGFTFLLSFAGLFIRIKESTYQTIAVLTILLLATFFFLRLLYN